MLLFIWECGAYLFIWLMRQEHMVRECMAYTVILVREGILIIYGCCYYAQIRNSNGKLGLCGGTPHVRNSDVDFLYGKCSASKSYVAKTGV